MFPALGGWELSPCAVLHLPFLPQWESGALSSVWSDSPGLCWAQDYFAPKDVRDLQNQGK